MGDRVLETLRERLDCTIRLRGNQLTLEGEEREVREAREVIDELVELVEGGHQIGAQTVEAVIGARGSDQNVREVLDDVVWRHRGKQIAPKTVTQKAYVDAIRRCTVTFGIGPAGTGKTYLAMALAVAALQERQVARIILTRPAVEAGERLGFLPGDMLAKVDPYLRPLFDALYDMLDPERANTYMERGTIEVAPLAFMRGRAQPLTSRVLTPDGFRAIGSLRVGDLVTGSDGLPTPVLGVYPQGRRELFRVRAQDGASTLCCGEHLWSVRTPEDRRRGRVRVLETREMAGRLRCFHQHRYELPLLSAPAEFEPRPVPVDPYALGLLLGDGCLTTKTTPTFTTADPELALALQGSLHDIELHPKGSYDYVLRHVHGGGRIANLVTSALRELDLAGTHSHTKFIPRSYLDNASGVRVALLQGLLDSDGGPVLPLGWTCRIQYTTCSPRFRDDVVALVRSLGGVAYVRRRAAHGRPPGRRRGRPVLHRTIRTSSISGFPRASSRSVSRASATRTAAPAQDARCGSSPRSSRPAGRRPSASRSRQPIRCMSPTSSSSLTTRSTTASSSSTRRRTPRPSRCRCSSPGSASARGSSSRATSPRSTSRATRPRA